MKKFITVLVIISLYSCGSRKVEKRNIEEKTEKKEKIIVEHDITAYDNITIKSKSFVIDSTKEEIEEIEVTPIDVKKPAYYDNTLLNNTKLVKRKIKRNKALKTETNTNTLHEGKSIDKSKETIQKEEQSKKNEKTKNVDQKQFDPLAFLIQYWWLWLIILFVIWLLKKYKEKMIGI